MAGFVSQGGDIEAQSEKTGVFCAFSVVIVPYKGLERVVEFMNWAIARPDAMMIEILLEVTCQREKQKTKVRLVRQLVHRRKTRKRDYPILVIFQCPQRVLGLTCYK